MTLLQRSISEFFKRRALLLGANRAAVYHWDKGDLGSSYLFDLNQDGLENFNRYLQETSNIPVSILVDLFEEEYRHEVIPHVFGADRASLIERKQARLFRDTPYLYAKVQGREETGRRDDRTLFSAITAPSIITPWVNLLDQHKVPLTGICSLPLFTASLLDSLPKKSKNMLIVSLQRPGGLRQTFFQNGEFRISRLVQMPKYGSIPYGPYIEDEIEKIHRYLMSMRLTVVEEPVDIYFLFSEELLEGSKKHYGNAGMIRYHFIDINQLADKGGSSAVSDGPFSDRYFVYEFLKRHHGNHYATSTQTRYSTLRNMRRWLVTASVLISLGGVTWGGLNFIDGIMLKQSSVSAEKKVAFYSVKYDLARKRLPRTPVSAADLKVAVKIAESLEHHKTSPLAMVKVVSGVLDNFNNIRLRDINWIASGDPNSKIAGDVSSSRKQRIQTPALTPDAGEDKYRFYQIAVINGFLDPFNGNFREAIAMINEFVEVLRKEKSVYGVEIVALPLDISSSASIRGSTDAVQRDAKFTVKVVVGIGDET